jgi:hypothetical protein
MLYTNLILKKTEIIESKIKTLFIFRNYIYRIYTFLSAFTLLKLWTYN